ncbi:MAG: nucleoside triphosphate pyrophosphohydrolase [Anaerolineales bacterium]|nr:nucleoside triphosphate pyrophosphohydrolase [Anaerolineales bacterium]
MSKIIYNKLVRDRIPEIIESAGKQYETEVMSEDEYVLALRQKLVEEALEAQKADLESIAIEIADLYEVIDALLAIHGLNNEEIIALQAKRRTERGAFGKRLKLLWSGT